ncbi:hypothetical protein [Glycomyces rhizosphaerae]|uniref:Uncharacterized protein n=1 Tax=Glycomyces rhizosphaerae TaxID=2054422 RepID=A0ABV7Q7V1_9ACTN
MELSRRNIENTAAAIDLAMKQLREAMVGLPDKEMGFKRSHESAARDAAHFMVLLQETARIN